MLLSKKGKRGQEKENSGLSTGFHTIVYAHASALILGFYVPFVHMPATNTLVDT